MSADEGDFDRFATIRGLEAFVHVGSIHGDIVYMGPWLVNSIVEDEIGISTRADLRPARAFPAESAIVGSVPLNPACTVS